MIAYLQYKYLFNVTGDHLIDILSIHLDIIKLINQK